MIHGQKNIKLCVSFIAVVSSTALTGCLRGCWLSMWYSCLCSVWR